MEELNTLLQASGLLNAESKITINVSGDQLGNLLDRFYQKGRSDALSEYDRKQADKPGELDMVSRKEAIRLLGISQTCIYEWEKKGYIKKYMRGGRVKYRLSDIERIRCGMA